MIDKENQKGQYAGAAILRQDRIDTPLVLLLTVEYYREFLEDVLSY
jgi:hypothetical protein